MALVVGAVQGAEQNRPTGYWRTSGKLILDSDGSPLRIAGVNWFGLETSSFAPHGLWLRGYKEMLDQIRSLGFNTIRLPFSNQLFDIESRPNGIDFARNPDLQGLSGIEIMDRVIAHAGKIGLRIILDRHRPDVNGQSELWYTAAFPETRWIDDWKMLAARYKGDPTVVAVDLHNEPRNPACWGCGELSLDWRLAAQRAGAAILEVNPNLLIIVQGVELYRNEPYWWGGNLRAAKDSPVLLPVDDRLVYSAHDYPASLYPQTWFAASNYPNNLPSLWDTHWGYLARTEIAPVLLGEFGSRLDTESDRQWFDSISSYVGKGGFHWTFWSWNPNSQDTGGLLLDDWSTVDERKMPMLKRIQSINYDEATDPEPEDATTDPTVPDDSSSEPGPAQPASDTTFCKADLRVINEWGSGLAAELYVTNSGAGPIDGWTIMWEFEAGTKLRDLWNAEYQHTGQSVTARNVIWNAKLAQGETVQLGFVAEFSGELGDIAGLTLNGFPCVVGR
jgi:aryl-phospho-beta-D-glucosidase BglC (GH1 family)